MVDGVSRAQECGIELTQGAVRFCLKDKPPEGCKHHFSDMGTRVTDKDIASGHQGFAQALVNSATTGRQKSGIGITWKQVWAIFKILIHRLNITH